MQFDLSENLCYFIDRGFYEQKMAIENMVFILSKHGNDNNANFLDSELFSYLHDKVIEKTMLKWYGENEIIKNFTNQPFKTYNFNLTHQKLFVE